MQRARRTADLAGFDHPQITTLLKEVDYGTYEGLTSAAIRQTNPGWELYKDGCPGGETPAHVYARALEFIDMATDGQGQMILAFAHGHILRAIATAWIQADIKLAAKLQLDVASISIMGEADRGRVIALWNSV